MRVRQPTVIRFDGFEVRPELLELRRGPETIRLEPKVLRVLVYLLEHRERVVEKSELLEVVWEEAFVTENALTKAIARLRQALEDDSQAPRFIQTVHTIGYRFIAEVEPSSPPGASAEAGVASREREVAASAEIPGRRRGGRLGRIVVGLILVAAALSFTWILRGPRGPTSDGAGGPRVRSLAVLPLANLTGSPEQDYLVEAIHDALIGELARLEPLRVISRQSTLSYRDSEKSIPRIAEELAVEALIEGSVMRSGDRVRVSAQLILATRDEHLWSRTFERGAGDLLVLVSEVAEAIGEEVEVVVRPDRRERQAAHRQVSPEVEEVYLRGRYAASLGTREALQQAAGLYTRAIELDPTFGRAHAGLAAVHLMAALLGHAPHRESFVASKAAARVAIELDPDLAEAHGILGLVHLYLDWDWPAAGRELKVALELGPQDALIRHGYGDYLLVMGRLEESLEQVRLGRLYDPASPVAVVPVIAHLVLLGRYEEVIDEVTTILGADPDMPMLGTLLETAFWARGEYGRSLDLIRERLSVEAPELVDVLDRGLSNAGPRGAMLALAESYAEREPPARRPRAGSIARYFARGGDAGRAFEFLERAVENREPGLLHLPAHPDFDSLRHDPRYQRLVERIGLPTERREESDR